MLKALPMCTVGFYMPRVLRHGTPSRVILEVLQKWSSKSTVNVEVAKNGSEAARHDMLVFFSHV